VDHGAGRGSDDGSGDHVRRVMNAGVDSRVGDSGGENPKRERHRRQFTADGRLFVRMPVVTLRGTYRVDGDMLSVEIFGQPPGRYPFRIENGELHIKSRGGEDRVYKRSECTLLKGY